MDHYARTMREIESVLEALRKAFEVWGELVIKTGQAIAVALRDLAESPQGRYVRSQLRHYLVESVEDEWKRINEH